jgi:hypothetical protein
MPRSNAQSSAYKNLSAATKADLSARAARIKAVLHRSLVEVGRELIEAKAILSHGQFIKWVEAECGMTARTAQLIMGAYRLCLKYENFSHLGRSALFALGVSDVPPSTLIAVQRLIDAGNLPTYSDVRSLVHAAKADRLSPVSLAVAVENAPAQAHVVDLETHRVLAAVRSSLAAADPAVAESVEQFRGRVDVNEIAIWLAELLDDGQIFRLTTLLRAAPSDATLDWLADALEAI